jgi:hypothetical protein
MAPLTPPVSTGFANKLCMYSGAGRIFSQRQFAEVDAPVRQATALAFKLVAYLVIFGVTMPVWGLLAWPKSLILAVVHTLLLWLSDLTVLPRFGNAVATVGDVGVLTLGSFLVLGAMGAMPNPAGLLMAIVAGTAFEWWFHRWLQSTAIIE